MGCVVVLFLPKSLVSIGKKLAYLKKTNSADVGGLSEVSGFPLIINSDFSVHWMSLHYFLELLKLNTVSSISTYALHILDFISQLEVERKQVHEVTDDWLVAYKNEVIQRGYESNNTENYACQLLRSVVSYCHWLTDNNFEPYLCGTSKLHKVQVTLTNKGKLQHSTFKNRAKDKRPIIVPRKDWIEVIKAYGPVRVDLAQRFELMIDWACNTGLRVHEICNLTIGQLPLRETAEKALAIGRNIPFDLIINKSGKPQRIFLSPTLIIKTWDYIELYRVVIIAQHKKKIKKKYSTSQSPQEIFLSSQTGSSINRRSFSNSIRSAFLKSVNAGELTVDEKVWAHGLRHHFVTVLLQALDEHGQKNPEQLAIQSTRHSTVDSMKPYLSERYNKGFQ